MRGWRIHEYGGAERLRLESWPAPEPADGELLVKVSAASLNPIDWKMREGHLEGIYEVNFPRVLGRDCAGVVAASRSPFFKPGDRVLAVAGAKGDGTHAEYARVPAAQAAPIPDGISDTEAVHFGIAGTSAWIPLAEMAKVGSGQRVLVHAGAGGVGSIGVQLARHLDAEVIATCGPANLEYVRSLGAHRAIDYTRKDFAAAAGRCDVVFDTVGGETHRRSFACLEPGGLMVYIVTSPVQPPPRTDVRVQLARVVCSSERLAKQLALAADGSIRPQVGQTFAFEDAPAAYEASRTGHARGKIVIVYR